MFRNSEYEFDLTSQGSGIWMYGFSTEAETAEKNENVAECIRVGQKNFTDFDKSAARAKIHGKR